MNCERHSCLRDEISPFKLAVLHSCPTKDCFPRGEKKSHSERQTTATEWVVASWPRAETDGIENQRLESERMKCGSSGF